MHAVVLVTRLHAKVTTVEQMLHAKLTTDATSLSDMCLHVVRCWYQMHLASICWP
jgi:hypothetical protein